MYRSTYWASGNKQYGFRVVLYYRFKFVPVG